MKSHTSAGKNYGQFLPLPKKTRIFLCYRGMTIHTPIESPDRVDKNYVVLKNVYCDLWPKNSVKMRFLKSSFRPKDSKKMIFLLF
jgi:hypothetical protein